jgi:Ankyrin repeats (many copies)
VTRFLVMFSIACRIVCIEYNIVCSTSAVPICVVQDDADMISLLVTRGANVNQRLRSNSNCLHAAVRNGSLAAVRALLAKGADVTALDDEGHSAAQLAEDFALPAVLASLLGAEIATCVDSSLEASRLRQQVRCAAKHANQWCCGLLQECKQAAFKSGIACQWHGEHLPACQMQACAACHVHGHSLVWTHLSMDLIHTMHAQEHHYLTINRHMHPRWRKISC